MRCAPMVRWVLATTSLSGGSRSLRCCWARWLGAGASCEGAAPSAASLWAWLTHQHGRLWVHLRTSPGQRGIFLGSHRPKPHRPVPLPFCTKSGSIPVIASARASLPALRKGNWRAAVLLDGCCRLTEAAHLDWMPAMASCSAGLHKQSVAPDFEVHTMRSINLARAYKIL